MCFTAPGRPAAIRSPTSSTCAIAGLRRLGEPTFCSRTGRRSGRWRGAGPDVWWSVRSRAPVRLDLAGGWTDVPPFSEEEGGAVVNIAISRYAYVSLRRRQDRRVHRRSDYYDTLLDIEDIGQL